jgi:hypothetical protein
MDQLASGLRQVIDGRPDAVGDRTGHRAEPRPDRSGLPVDRSGRRVRSRFSGRHVADRGAANLAVATLTAFAADCRAAATCADGAVSFALANLAARALADARRIAVAASRASAA